MSFVKRIQNTIFHHNLIKKGDKIIVAVSGGPDSTCLLEILTKLKDKYSLELIIAHVNYRLRGRDSDGDEKFVKKLAQKYNLPIEILQPKISSKNNLESKLRDIRYEFFERIRNKYKFDSIAVAHNLDDQVETFLLRLLRGAGLTGLSSMKYKNRHIIRPLLATKRLEIKEYLRSNNLKYRIDKTNLESKFTRNKVRNKLIPYLEKNFNPAIADTLFRAIENIADDYSLLDELTEKTYRNNQKLSVQKLLKLHPALQKRVLLRAIAEKKSDLKDISSANIKEIVKIVKSIKNKQQVVLFKGLKLVRKGDRLEINQNDAETSS